MYYDTESKGKPNDWVAETYENHYLPEGGIKGPVMVFEMLNNNKKDNWATLNFHRAIMYMRTKTSQSIQKSYHITEISDFIESWTTKDKCTISKCLNCQLEPNNSMSMTEVQSRCADYWR